MRMVGKGGKLVPGAGIFGPEISGNFLIGRPALLPFGGIIIDKLDEDEQVTGKRRRCDEVEEGERGWWKAR